MTLREIGRHPYTWFGLAAVFLILWLLGQILAPNQPVRSARFFSFCDGAVCVLALIHGLNDLARRRNQRPA